MVLFLHMARVAITEYAAKKLVLGESYTGVTVTRETVTDALTKLKDGIVYIVKIDVGIKKRGKQGLLRLNVEKNDIEKACLELFDLGYDRCVIEEMVSHETAEERYISIDVQRDGAQLLYSSKGGVEIEENHDAIERFFVPRNEVLQGTPTIEIDSLPLPHILQKMHEFNMSFIEINPFIIRNGLFTALDMAVEVDDAKAHKLPAWVQEHIVKKANSPAEKEVQRQDEMTSAALTLKILNKNGSILTLFSGGGASLVAMDALVGAGLQEQIINYSEYSGAPTRDETHSYANTLLKVLFDSESSKKVILIAGGIANFTDILLTFAGIVEAFSECITKLQEQNVYVCIRRGGPNQEKGLAHLRTFLTSHNIPHDVYGPELSLGEVGVLVKKHI